MAREPRFPGVVWYCDHCGALLSEQKGFDDHKYTWRCRECGFKNSISWDNISRGDSKSTQLLLHLLGFLSYVGFWTSIMLAASIFAFDANSNKYLPLLFVFLGMYLLASVVTTIVQFAIRHTHFSVKNLAKVILMDLTEDIVAPFMFIKELVSNFLSFITHLLPVKRKYRWHSNKAIIAMAFIYVLLFILEFVAFSYINGFGLDDWFGLISAFTSRFQQG